MTIQITGIAHVRLTVTDIVRSRAFYEEVFGFPVAMEPPPADAPQEVRDAAWFLFGGVIFMLPGGLIMGLRPVAAAGDRFDADRVGLDHLSFGVADRAALDDAVALLDARGVAHDGVKDIGSMFILEFRDPDENALELSAPKG